jgi:hypothetical protein
MIKLQLINADIIYDTAIVTSLRFRKGFNCKYNPRMDYAFCLLTLNSSEKWRSPLFGATCNFNDQILPYSILFLTFINTNVFYLMSFNFHANLLRPWRFPLTTKCPWKTLPNFRCDTWDIHFSEALCTCGRESNLMNRHLRNKSWKPECVGSFNMGWRIEYTNIRQPMLKLKTHSGFHDLFRFWYV